MISRIHLGVYWSAIVFSFALPVFANAAHIVTPSCTLTPPPAAIRQGETARLSWKTENAIRASIGGIGPVGLQGFRDVTPPVTTYYVMTVSSGSATSTCSAYVTVTPPAPPPPPPAPQPLRTPLSPPAIISPIIFTPIVWTPLVASSRSAPQTAPRQNESYREYWWDTWRTDDHPGTLTHYFNNLYSEIPYMFSEPPVEPFTHVDSSIDPETGMWVDHYFDCIAHPYGVYCDNEPSASHYYDGPRTSELLYDPWPAAADQRSVGQEAEAQAAEGSAEGEPVPDDQKPSGWWNFEPTPNDPYLDRQPYVEDPTPPRIEQAVYQEGQTEGGVQQAVEGGDPQQDPPPVQDAGYEQDAPPPAEQREI